MLPAAEPARPIEGGTSRPGIGGQRQALPRGAAEAFGAEVQERAAHVAQGRATLGAVERGLDDRALARGQPPRALDLGRGAAGEVQPAHREVLDLEVTALQWPAAGE